MSCLQEFFGSAPKYAHSVKLKGLCRNLTNVFRPSNFTEWAHLWAHHILNAQSCVVLLYFRPVYAKSGARKLVSDGHSVQLMSVAASYVSRVRLCEVALFGLKNWVCLVTILCSKYCEFNKPIVRLLGWLARQSKSTLSSPQPMRAHPASHEPRRLPKTT